MKKLDDNIIDNNNSYADTNKRPNRKYDITIKGIMYNLNADPADRYTHFKQ